MSEISIQHYHQPTLEVVRVSSQNIEQAAEWCGGSINEVPSRRVPGRMDRYVRVPTPKGNKTSWAFPGMYITKRIVVTDKDQLKVTFAVFRRDYFEKNTFLTADEALYNTWGRAEREGVSLELVESARDVALAMQDALDKKFGSIVEQREIARENEIEQQANITISINPEMRPNTSVAAAMAKAAAKNTI